MRFFNRIFLSLIPLLCLVLPIAAQQTCIYANAGPDDTVCTGQCSLLIGDISGTRNTNSYTTLSIPYAPNPFTGGNPVLVNLDDLWSPAIPIPFCFDFYGSTYNQIVIGTNGVASFDVSQANGTCTWSITNPIPDPGMPMNSIMAPFHDIDPTIPTAAHATSINWNVYGSAPCRTFVINWNDVAMYGLSCDSLISTSQIVLHETTNIIDIYIQTVSSCSSWNSGAAIEGIQNANGTAAVPIPGRNFPTVWSAANDGVSIVPTGPPFYTLQWTDPGGNVIGTSSSQLVCPAQTTTYTLQMVNTSCSGTPVTMTDQVTVVVTPSSLALNDSVIYPSCSGTCNGSITLYPSSGMPPYTYTWLPNISNGPSASSLCPGIYICSVTDGSGCTVSVTINLSPPPPFLLLATATPTLCNDSTGTATAQVTGGTAPFTYQWSNGDTTAFISGLVSGLYQVVVTDSSGCPDSTLAYVSTTGLQLGIQATSLLCNGDCNAIATVNPQSGVAPFTYVWTPYGGTGVSSTGLCSGTFYCAVTDSLGCTSTTSVTITSPSAVVITPNANQTICFGGSTSVSAVVTGGTPPYTYSWNNSLPPNQTNAITPTQTTIYTCVATDSNGCTSAPNSTLVKVNNAPLANFSFTQGMCPPAAVDFSNLTDSAVSYSWNFGDPSSGSNDTSSLFAPSHTYANGGNYTVVLIATNAYGCTDTVTFPNGLSIPNAANAGLSASAGTISTLDPVTTLNNLSTNAVSYVIYFGDGDSLVTNSIGPYTHTYDSLGTFTVTLIAWSADGCPDTTYLTIIVEEPTTCFIPNAFTPNGDGNNDAFMVYGINIEEFQLLIFNRWGELIFQTDDVNRGWNGKYKDSDAQEDVYVWRLNYTDNEGQSFKRIGHVALIR